MVNEIRASLSPNVNMNRETLRPLYAVGGETITIKDLHESQESDPQLDAILLKQSQHHGRLKYFLRPVEMSDPPKKYKIYIIESGQPYVPKTLRYHVFKLLHEQTHPGISRTLSLVKNYFFGLT